MSKPHFGEPVTTISDHELREEAARLGLDIPTIADADRRLRAENFAFKIWSMLRDIDDKNNFAEVYKRLAVYGYAGDLKVP
jgi:hypothetical protein